MSAGRPSVEGFTQVAIMLAIGGAAGAASFTHVHDVAAAHGQPGWLAWADAVVLELMSVASGLEMRRRKRTHAPVGFPAAVLVVAMTLSLSAQVVDAEASAIGWIAAAIPALGFLVMVKIALAQAPQSSTSVKPAILGLEELSARAAVPVRDRPDTETVPDRTPDETPRSVPAAPPQPGAPAIAQEPTPPSVPLPSNVIAAASAAADALSREGRRVSRQALADALRASGHAVSNARASEVLQELKAQAAAAGGAEIRRFQPVPRTGRPTSLHAVENPVITEPEAVENGELGEERSSA